MSELVAICSQCKEGAEFYRESFDYAGGHSNNGNGGKHYTGEVLSTCCDAEAVEETLEGFGND